MGDYVFLSNYIQGSVRIREVVEYLQSHKISYEFREAVSINGRITTPDTISIFVVLPMGYVNVIDIFDGKSIIGEIPVYLRFIKLYEEEFQIKIDNFLKILSNKRSIKSFNYTKSRSILMLVVEVDNKVGCIPSNILLNLNKSFDPIYSRIHSERIMKISNVFGCDPEELTQILGEDLREKYGIDINDLDIV